MGQKISGNFLSIYDVAVPETYEAFPLDPGQQTPAAVEGIKAEALATPAVTPSEPKKWQDEDAQVPKVKPKDAKDFEPPETASKSVALVQEVSRKKRAVWIVHGMGQQIPFETVDSLTRGLLDAIQPQVVKPRLRNVKIGKEVLQRVELEIDGREKDAAGHVKQYELHLYESYWAPKTEGVAKLADVVSFLWDGGLRGMLNWVKSFKRAMFGGMATFSIRALTPLWLSLALLILVALTIINGVVLAASGAQTGIVALAGFKAHWCQLAALASCMIAVAFSFGAVLFITDMSKPQQLPRVWHGLLGFLGWAAVIATGFEIVKTAFLMAVITHLDWNRDSDTAACGLRRACEQAATVQPSWIHTMGQKIRDLFANMPSPQIQGFATGVILTTAAIVAVAMITRAVLRSSERQLRGHWGLLILSVAAFAMNVVAVGGCMWVWAGGGRRGVLPSQLCFMQSPVWVWPFLILFSAKVREIMLQYVGDVAIYVRPNKLDRFDEVRTKIKEAARIVASAVFTAYKPHQSGEVREFLYPHVAVVGHSLGSVIAYDTLNRLMLDDWLSKNALRIAERTKTMVTFGSPLNKTAFLFTIQGSDSLHIRERLASIVQPLITSYPKFRKLNWINVYSRNDIISGKLRFYDLPGFQDDPVPPQGVRNVVDKDASVPLVAHVAYWKNRTVWNELLSQIAP